MAALDYRALEGQSPTDRICAKRIERGDTAVIKSVFHVNINVTDFDRSLAFYKLLGFKVVLDLGEGPNHGNDVGLNIANSKARAALLSLSDDPRATRIDLIEWKQPRTAGESYPHLVPYGDRSHFLSRRTSSSLHQSCDRDWRGASKSRRSRLVGFVF